MHVVDECWCCCFFFFQAEDGIRDLVRSRGLGDVYKRQDLHYSAGLAALDQALGAASRNSMLAAVAEWLLHLSLIHI